VTTAPAAAQRAAPAVVTGIGVAAPTGLSTETYWAATLAGIPGIRPVSRFAAERYSCRLAGEVPEFDPAAHLPGRLLPQTDPMTRLALIAAQSALLDAGAALTSLDEFSMGVVTAASGGGIEFGQRELQNLWFSGKEHVSAYQSFAWFYAVNTGQISIRHGMRGPSGVIVTEQAGGLDAVGQARRRIRQGASLMVTGGVDGALCPGGWAAQLATGNLTRRSDPALAYQPFGIDADGYVPAEGCAILVLEPADAAERRGAAQVYGEIAGYAATHDPRPGSGRPPGLRRAIELALADGGAEPSEVDVVFADGAGVPAMDKAEAQALESVFGAYGVPVTVPKSLTGRMFAGGAALDLAAALLAIRDDVIPPTVGTTAWRFNLDLVTTVRRTPLRTALVLARGIGGFNAAVLVRGPARSAHTSPVPSQNRNERESHEQD